MAASKAGTLNFLIFAILSALTFFADSSGLKFRSSLTSSIKPAGIASIFFSNSSIIIDEIKSVDGVEEKVKAYGWHCDGSDIIGHYVTTESYQLLYNMQGVFTKMVPLRELSQSIA